VNTSDEGGGAEKVAYNLHRAYRSWGCKGWLAVGYKRTNDKDVLVIQNDTYGDRWARAWITIDNYLAPFMGESRGARRARMLLYLIGQPMGSLEILCGHENFDFSGTWRILDLPPEHPDIVHFHNLHGDYFDLRALPWLSQQVPAVLTLHDAWLLSGHCAHSFECGRWKTGCGQCPNLGICPAIRRDATAYNWRFKRNIYTQCKLYVATPSLWLMRKVEQSMLAPAIVEARVIHNGVDLTIFYPGDRQYARAMLGNPWRDYATLEQAVKQVAEGLPDERVILVCLGEEQKPKRIGKAEVQFLGYRNDPVSVALFYQAADIYSFASKADTFPNTVLEALACGTPVVATAVCGIPEQIEDGVTGFLVTPGDVKAMAARIEMLLREKDLRRQLGEKAAEHARRRFDLNHQVKEYLTWYEEIVGAWDRKESSRPA
jgi:glycosyltransferase involved in cell wall biosynthesis